MSEGTVARGSGEAGSLETGGYVEFGERHLAFREDTPYEVWSEVVKRLKSAEKSIQWWLGDALRFGERKYGEKYSQALEETDYSYGTLRNAVWVAEAFSEVSSRDDRLSFRHHRAVASLDPPERERLLKKAAPGPGEDRPRMSARELEDLVAEARVTPGEARGEGRPEKPTRRNVETVEVVRCPRCEEEYPMSEALVWTVER